MATFSSLLSSTPLSLRPSQCRLLPLQSLRFSPLRLPNHLRHWRIAKTLVFASSASSFGEFNTNNGNYRSKKSVLLNFIQEIEPLDVSLIQKDVPPTTLDAMKRTISGILGLLPSDQFQVSIEALWEPLSKLLFSSMMTGYTLRNAEYRLCLERNLDIHVEDAIKLKTEDGKLEAQVMLLNNDRKVKIYKRDELLKLENLSKNTSENIGIQGLGQMTPETQRYILSLQSQLSLVKKELHEVKRKSAALQMQQLVGEEKNDLLDFLRSLQPDKVAKLSEPACPELKETVHSVVHGLLATLSPKMHSKAPHLSENSTTEIVNVGSGEDCVDLVGNTSLQFQPLILLARDYLARLLFWCMLLGHYLRGLEYRLELMELLSLPSEIQNDGCGGDQVS